MWRNLHTSNSNEIENVPFIELTGFVGHFLIFCISATNNSITIERLIFLLSDLLQRANHVHCGEIDNLQIEMKSKIRFHSFNILVLWGISSYSASQPLIPPLLSNGCHFWYQLPAFLQLSDHVLCAEIAILQLQM